MTLKGVAKFKQKLTCGLKNDIRNLVNFHTSSWKCENLHIDGLHLSKASKGLDEKVQKRYVSWHWRVMQSLKKNWKNFMRNLMNFNASSGTSGNSHFDVLLLPIAHRVSAWKVQKNCVSWRWKKIKTSKKNWLFIWKMTWGILVNFNLSSAKSENLHFCRKYVILELKRYQRSCVVKNNLRFQKWQSNLVNLHTSTWK